MDGLGSDTEEPNVDLGSGYTAAQIAQMRSDQQKKIKDLEFQIKMADAEYKIMQKEVSDGNIYALSDGTVVSLLTEEEAKQNSQPILKVSGGGGFYVEGFVSELEKAKMQPGQEVTVDDWNTGMTYTGTIDSIGDFPSQNGYYNGSGNPNASYYPFRVFVDESADLQAGSYVNVRYSTAQSQNCIYLENPFLRTEKGRSYVFVLGRDGKLEQRFVATGKSLWGSYTEILSGLSAEDLIAFPYGKNVKHGVAALEGDLSNLYG
jgi:multidrug efflux pump subunit AcrA (membrane-fusion protein)